MLMPRHFLPGTVLAAALFLMTGCADEPTQTADESPPPVKPDVVAASEAEAAEPETETATVEVTPESGLSEPAFEPPPLELPGPEAEGSTGDIPVGLPDPTATAPGLPDIPAASDEAMASWTTDFEAAKKTAKAEGKDILLDFTGSDWCTWCIRLDNEVFKHQPFYDYANENFVLVKLDFPRTPGAITDELKAQNQAVKDYYGSITDGFPTILLTDAEGRAYARTGFEFGGPRAYAAHLADLKEIHTERDASFTAAAELEGIEKAKKLEEGLLTMAPPLFFPNYESIINEIIQLDADNSAGLNEKYTEQRDSFQFFQRVSKIEQLANAGDLKENVDDVLAAMDQLADDFPEFDRGQLVLSAFRVVILAAAERDDDAVATGKEVLKKEDLPPPLRSQVLNSVVGTLLDADRFEECIAVADSQIGLQSDPFEKTNMLLLKARCQINLKDIESAKKSFEAARETGGPQFWDQIDAIEKRMLAQAAEPDPSELPAPSPEEAKPEDQPGTEDKPEEGTESAPAATE